MRGASAGARAAAGIRGHVPAFASRIASGRKLEWAAFALFCALYLVVTSFHEPWFDEAQAWQIAKCASLHDMLFEIPHYEGHPPLWHLILAVPAKLGVPFELGLKSVGFLFSAASAWLILFKMPYPRAMRLLVPFSYFVFYQYGVIVRPYCVMLLVMLLLALDFPNRDAHPWRYVALLALLCLTSAYGMLLAAGIAACVAWDVLREKGARAFFSGLMRDARTLSLLALLAFAVLLALCIVPRADTYVASSQRINPFPMCLAVSLLTFIPEVTLTTGSWFRTDTVLLQNSAIPLAELAAIALIGVLLWVVLASVATRRNLKYLLVPYILFALFAAAVYFSPHHLGIAALLLLFWLGIALRDSARFELGRMLLDRVAGTGRDRRMARGIAIVLAAACLVVPVTWTARAAATDVQLDYSYGRAASEFLRDTGLDHASMLCWWGGETAGHAGESDEDDAPSNTYDVGEPVLINAYFDRNLCFNLNRGADNVAYKHYGMADAEQSATDLAEWATHGASEMLLGMPDLEAVYGDAVAFSDYSLVRVFDVNYAWKFATFHSVMPLYLRNDLLEKYGLEPLTDPKYAFMTGIQITDEMMEDLRNGVPAEEVLKPTLDAVFGEEDE